MAGTSAAEPGQVWEVADCPEGRATASDYSRGLWAGRPGEGRKDAVAAGTTQQAIAELRRISGLTWEQLAELFGVSRRSVHFWASGHPLSANNEERLRQALAVIRAMDRGFAMSNRAALLEGQPGGRALDLLKQQRFGEAGRLLGKGVGRVSRNLPGLSKQALAEREPLPPDVLVDAHEEPVHRETGRSRPAKTKRGKRRGDS